MGVNTDYPNVVSGRISDRDKELMKKYDFTVRDAIEMYIHFRLNPKIWRKELIKKIEQEQVKLNLSLAANDERLRILKQMDDDL